MALEGIQAVTQAEAKAKADRDAAAAQARQQLADAQRQARQLWTKPGSRPRRGPGK